MCACVPPPYTTAYPPLHTTHRIKGWVCQDCDRSTAECLVLFVLANLRRDWHMTAKNPGAFLMGLLQHRCAARALNFFGGKSRINSQ